MQPDSAFTLLSCAVRIRLRHRLVARFVSACGTNKPTSSAIATSAIDPSGHSIQTGEVAYIILRSAFYSTMSLPRNMPIGHAKVNSPGSFGRSSTGTVSPVGSSALLSAKIGVGAGSFPIICQCPLVAIFGHCKCTDECPLLGVKRTWRGLVNMSANDPKRTLGRLTPRLNPARAVRRTYARSGIRTAPVGLAVIGCRA